MLDLTMPPKIIQRTLPSQNLSVNKFLLFNLPSASSTPPRLQAERIYISAEQPNTYTKDIQHWMIVM
jgi:hypothetical protein